MQKENQETQQSNLDFDSQDIMKDKGYVQIDNQLVKAKVQLLIKYYQCNSDNQRIQIVKNWPTPQIATLARHIEAATKTNNGWYFGNVCNQMFHGAGLLIYHQTDNRSGRFYEGEFQNNCKHGYGFEYIGEDMYIGKFVNNKPEDNNGIFLWKNGDLFMGSFVNGMKHGQGRWQSGTDYYEGSWKLNRPEGYGKIHSSASQYQGDVRNGYKHGRGLQIFSNGDRYQGLYANGKPEGDGIYCWQNGAIYKGQFKNGIRYGYGSWSFGSQSYEGDYVNDRRNGQGLYKWGSGSYYKGEFLDDLRHGFGQMHWNEASYYKGEWRQGHQNGQGQIWQEGNLIVKGNFEDGKFVREPNKLLKSNQTQSNISNSLIKRQKRVISENNKLNSFKQPSRARQLNQEKDKSFVNRYPNIEKKGRAASQINNHNQQNLVKIEQFPKLEKTKKHMVSTSFSHTPKNDGSYKFNQSFDQQHARTTLKNNQRMIEPEERQNQAKKRQQLKQKSPPQYGASKQKKIYYNSNIHSKKRIYDKKKVYGNTKGIKPTKTGTINEFKDTDLEPIKWRNFTKIKNQTADIHITNDH